MAEHHRASFEKARRNLMLVSVGLSFVVLSGIEFEKISILGNSAKINNPVFVKIFIGLLWVYFIDRFVRYRQEPFAEEQYQSRLRVEKNKWIASVLRRHPRRFVVEVHNSPHIPIEKIQSGELKIYGSGFSLQREMDGWWESSFYGSLFAQKEGQDKPDAIPTTVRFRGINLWRLKFISRARVLFGSHLFNEYYLPAIVASAPVLAAAYVYLLR